MTKSLRAVDQEAQRLAQEALPAYSSKFSRKDFTQHQLFAVLALMTFLKTDYRGVIALLEDYARTLTTAKIQEVRDAVVRCFTQLWRKGDLVRRIDIDPTDFSVTLFDRQDRPVPKAQLSAGEKQIYAISVLWALAQVSGRPLPMVIDTPLGRLDSDHRGHLVDRYFPQASHQVVILSTDTEIDQAYFRALSASISHAYHLRYDPVEARCVIEKGYFWSGQETEAAHAAQ